MPIKLRQFAKPKNPEQTNPVPDPTPIPDQPVSPSDAPLADSQDPEPSQDKLKELYSNIKSVPNYSAKIKEFLQEYDGHNQYKRIIKKVFPRRRVIARFPFDV